MVTFTLKIDEEMKTNVEATCATLGISMEVATRLFLSYVSKEKRLPFPVEVWKPVPLPPAPLEGVFAYEVMMEFAAHLHFLLISLANASTNEAERQVFDDERRRMERECDAAHRRDPSDNAAARALMTQYQRRKVELEAMLARLA